MLARFSTQDAPLDSYAVPVHVDVHLRRLISLHFAFDGTQYYKRPGRVALQLRAAPPQFRRLFSEMGSPLTWDDTYDLRMLNSEVVDGREVERIEGVPKKPGAVKRLVLNVDRDASVPLHGQWMCNDGTMIAMSMLERADGSHTLPSRSEADLIVAGFRIHAVIDYGTYALNVPVDEAVFNGS